MSTAASPRRTPVARLPRATTPAIDTDATSDATTPWLTTLRAGGGGQLPSVQAESLLWGLPPQLEHGWAQKLVALLAKGTVSAARGRQVESALATWLTQREANAATAWEAVVWLHYLPQLSALLNDAILEQFGQRCGELSSLATKDAWEEDPVRFQLLAIELPLLMSRLSGKSSESRATQAQTEWDGLAASWLDEQGVPRGKYLSAMRPVLASWTRCCRQGLALLPAERRVKYIGLLRQTMLLLRSDGGEPFTANADRSFVDGLRVAVELSGDPEAALLHSALLPGARLSRRGSLVGCSPSLVAEANGVAILRSQLSRESPQITVAFDEPQCRLELVANVPLLSGEWRAELSVDGEQFTPSKAWEIVCWHEDEDVVYLELETPLGPDWNLQRHILLAREEGFALLADAVIGEREASISYTSSLPLFPGVSLQAERETHEAWLVSSTKRWLTLPLSLPEWRSDRPVGSLAAADGKLTLTTNARRGRSLFQPLLIPLSSFRGKVDYTWRQLTVGEQLQIQPTDTAAAFRIQVGDRQWVVYRALSRGSRTFLGRNLTSEFFVGTFHRTGQMDAIMEVE